MKTVDLRSDTVTLPTQEMRRVLAEAPVGDAGYGDDPSVNELERLGAEITGQEDCLFVPSGIMGNLIAILSHCRRGDAVLVGDRAHMYRYEGGGMAVLAGILPYLVDDIAGVPTPEAIRAACPVRDVHFAQPSLLCLENTHNDRGGLAVSPQNFAQALESGRDAGLAVHLDGARIFNAAVAWGVDIKEYTVSVDSVQFCLSKGLGAPMGSLVCGSQEFIARARFERKRLGGKLRQAGFMAMAGLYALKHHVSRLADDHRNAELAESLLMERGLATEPVFPGTRRTNMVYFNLPEKVQDVPAFAMACARRGVLFNASESPRVRLVFHLGVEEEDVRSAVSVIHEEVQRF